MKINFIIFIVMFLAILESSKALGQQPTNKLDDVSESIILFNAQSARTFANFNETLSNVNTLAKTWNQVGLNAQHITYSLQGKNAQGDPTWWAADVRDIFNKLLPTLKYAMTALAAILGRMLWTVTKSIDDQAQHEVKMVIGEDQRVKSPITHLFIDKWIKVQRKLRGKQ